MDPQIPPDGFPEPPAPDTPARPVKTRPKPKPAVTERKPRRNLKAIRAEAVRRVREDDEPIPAIAAELGVNYNTLFQWVRRAGVAPATHWEPPPHLAGVDSASMEHPWALITWTDDSHLQSRFRYYPTREDARQAAPPKRPWSVVNVAKKPRHPRAAVWELLKGMNE